MTVTTHTVTTLAVDDLPFDAVLDFTPVDWIDPVVTKRENGTYTVAYAVLDDDHMDSPLAEDEAVDFREFTSEAERDAWMAEFDPEVHAVFVVDHYEHGGHHYSLSDTVQYHHGAWDTRPSCVIALDKRVFSEGMGEDFNIADSAKALLDTYNEWVAGNVYGIVRQDFDAHGGPTGEEIQHVWGFIGTSYAEEVVKDIDSHL